MKRRPPRSPPFPYTTLFRSSQLPQAGGRSPDADEQSPDAGLQVRTQELQRPGLAARDDEPSPAAVHQPGERLADGDRKSTRLNSSHANISYAVFCLTQDTYT